MADLSVLTNNPDIMISWDRGDPYGSAMHFWFDAAEWLHFNGLVVPDRWRYKPAASPEPENHFSDISYRYDEIVAIGDACQRVAEECKRTGQSY